jgi:hypothetical protein
MVAVDQASYGDDIKLVLKVVCKVLWIAQGNFLEFWIYAFLFSYLEHVGTAVDSMDVGKTFLG